MFPFGYAIVNGEIYVNSNIKPKQEGSAIISDPINHLINNLQDTINVHNKVKHSPSNKHRILLVGDSHIRGYASALQPLLNSGYDIYSVVKPGSGSKELKNSAKEVIRQLSYDDLIVICSGTNDLELNGFTETFQNIKEFVTNTKHTNTLLMNIPFRCDIPNSYSANKDISALNRKLEKLVKIFPHTNFIGSENDRKRFTKHGLHRNKLGKQLVTLQLSHFLLNTFDQKRILLPISLGWYETDEDNNLHCTLEQVNTCNRNSSHNRKMPVTRSNDFLWLI